ncbi:MAG: hypothetical protein MJ094_08825 [Saccharofermentans sp.]|nr:hypothetical protein [Saccharofermentans sp.]
MQAIALDAPFKAWVFVGIFVLSFISSIIVILFTNKWLNKLLLESVNRKPWMWGIATCLLTIAVYSIYLLGQYPGGLSPDSVLQFDQALGHTEYSNWHPVIHTLIIFTIPVKLGKRLACIVFFQIVYFALAFGYLIYVMAKNGLNYIAVILFDIYIVFNPYLATYMMIPWKDLAFMIFSIWMIACYIQIVCTKGMWLVKWYNSLSYSLALVLGNCMRHNAILFVLPLVVITLVFVVKSKKTRIMLICFFIILSIIPKTLVASMNLTPPGRRVTETIGLPATIWSNVIKTDEKLLSPDTMEKLLTIASVDDYRNVYIVGDFNELKFSGKCDNDALNDFTYGEALTYLFECFKVAPHASFEALAKLTRMFWDYSGYYKPLKVELSCFNYCGIVSNPKAPMSTWVDNLKTIVNNPIGSTIFGSYGFMMLCLFVVASSLFANNRKSFIHILPIFFYNGGTALLLSTNEDYRFFLFTIAIWFPLIFVMIKEKEVLG